MIRVYNPEEEEAKQKHWEGLDNEGKMEHLRKMTEYNRKDSISNFEKICRIQEKINSENERKEERNNILFIIFAIVIFSSVLIMLWESIRGAIL